MALSAMSSVSAVSAWGLSRWAHVFLLQVEQEQQGTDALVAIGEGMVLDDEVEQMRRLCLAGVR